MIRTAIGRLRLVGMLEGISFLLLLFVAMPLKYVMGLPLAVRIAGSAHGVLFLAFLYQLFAVTTERGWSIRRIATVFVASLVPFGPFVLDRSLAREDEEATSVAGV